MNLCLCLGHLQNGCEATSDSCATQNTAWFLQHGAMTDTGGDVEQPKKSGGYVEQPKRRRPSSFNALVSHQSAMAQMLGDRWPSRPTPFH